MRLRLLFLLLAATVVSTAGCRSLQVQAGLQTPTATTRVTPSATAATPTALPIAVAPTVPPTVQPTTTPTPAPGIQPVPGNPPAATPPARVADQGDAVQTLLDYFDAINQQDYARAYGYWAGKGAASGQSFEAFSRGYADTVRVSVQLGTVSSQGAEAARRVTIESSLTSIVNLPDHSQKVQRYRGTYTLQPSGASGGWEIAGANVSEVAGGPQPPADVADPVALLQAYFDAVNRREFPRAFTYWDHLGQSSQQSFAQFEQGFATTRQVKADIGTPQYNAGAGNVYADVPVTIVAIQNDGSTRSYTGMYTAHRANVPPFDQLGWRIEGAKVTETAASTRDPMSALRPLHGGWPGGGDPAERSSFPVPPCFPPGW